MQVRFSRSFASLGVAVGLACLVALSPASGTRAGAQAAPPPPPVPNATITPAIGTTPVPSTDSSAPATPSAAPSPAPPTAAPSRRGRRHRGAAAGASPSPAASGSAPEPTATPTSPAFATLDGSWEVQLQYIDHTEYSYFAIKQNPAGALSGTWRVGGKTFPIAGTYDGRLLRFTSTGGPGLGPVSVSGYVEGASDMIGLVDFGGGALVPIPAVPLAVPGASPPARGKVAVPVAIATGTGTPPPLSATPPPSSGTPFTAEHRAGAGGLFTKKK